MDESMSVLLEQVIDSLPAPLRYVANVLDCYLALAAGRRVFTVRQCRPQGGAL